jgi:putative DNA primase/helicase
MVYYPEFKLWLAMNNKPRIIGTDDGIWRRVRLIPFNARIPEARKIKEFHKVLFAEEGPGILNRILEGLRAWRAEGLEPSGAVKKATQEFREEQNVVQRFFDEHTVSGKNNYHAKAGDLFERYKGWSETNNEYAIRQNEFAEELQRRGFVKRRVHDDGFHWFGITLKDSPLEEEGMFEPVLEP